jgi:hypothetical protein
VLLKLLDKQRIVSILSGITWPKLRKTVKWNIDEVIMDHGGSHLTIIEQFFDGFEETMK